MIDDNGLLLGDQLPPPLHVTLYIIIAPYANKVDCAILLVKSKEKG